jgi:hypothetical protein
MLGRDYSRMPHPPQFQIFLDRKKKVEREGGQVAEDGLTDTAPGKESWVAPLVKSRALTDG